VTTREHLREAEALSRTVLDIIEKECSSPDALTMAQLKLAHEHAQEIVRHLELAGLHEQRAPMYAEERLQS
jgi:hypothetical protein